jgi:NAD dependent epimerase/dehydratase family enzyme
MPWIHIDDIVHVFYQAISNENYSGAINASATESCTNLEFSKTLAKILGRKLLPIHVPSVVLKMVLGDMSAVVLEGSRVSNSKLRNLGYQFKFEKLEDALNNLVL